MGACSCFRKVMSCKVESVLKLFIHLHAQLVKPPADGLLQKPWESNLGSLILIYFINVNLKLLKQNCAGQM